MSFFKSNKILCDCDAAVRLIVYIYFVFVGNGWLAHVPLHLPHLRLFCLEKCYKVRDEHVEEIVAAIPELKVIK
jgi:hypothetical protein